MAFEEILPGAFTSPEPLKEGEVSVSKCGKLSLLAADLALVGIARHAVVLADSATFRVALRAPREGEAHKCLAVSVVMNKSKRGTRTETTRRQINASRAIRHLGIDAGAVAGRYRLNIKGDKGGLLIINLEGATVEDRQRDARREELEAQKQIQ